VQRVKLFAAKVGYELPMPPAPRYELPAGTRRVFCDSESEGNKKGKQIDHTLMPKGDGAATWWDVLTAAPTAVSPGEGELLPHVTLAEAIGDLPPLLTPSSGPTGPRAQQQQQPTGNSSSSSGAASGVAQQQQQQQGCGSGDHMPAEGSLQQQLDMLRESGRDAAAATLQHKSGRRAHRFGLDVQHYNPQQGVLLPVLPPPVADLRPTSVFAQYCRSRHWSGQGLRGFNPGLLLWHAYSGPTTNLPVSGDSIMQPLGVVGTVCGHSTESGSSVHFGESRRLSHFERVSGVAGQADPSVSTSLVSFGVQYCADLVTLGASPCVKGSTTTALCAVCTLHEKCSPHVLVTPLTCAAVYQAVFLRCACLPACLPVAAAACTGHT
jgi:hypothetical protein